jgi:predicted RNA-binding Zn-ribbon protein involved in translation (DUF1610 family)
MTVEHRIVVDLSDIKSVSFECTSCHAVITASPDKAVLPAQCDQCGTVAMKFDTLHRTSSSPEQALLSALAAIRKQQPGKSLFTIRFDFEAPVNV